MGDTEEQTPLPLPKKFLAVPTVLLRRLGMTPLRATPRSRRSAMFESIRVPVTILPCATEMVRAGLLIALHQRAKDRGLTLAESECKIDGQSAPICVVETASVTSEQLDKEKMEALSEQDQKFFLKADEMLLGFFSQVTGLKVRHLYGGLIVQAPVEAPEDTIVLFSHARPPGFNGEAEIAIKDLCGVPVWKDGTTRLVRTPTRGRGRLIEVTGLPVFQVLGNNYYQLCLTYSEHHEPFARALIFMQLLGEILKDLDAQAVARPRKRTGTASKAAFAEFATSVATNQLDRLRKDADKTNRTIEELQDELAKQLQKQRDLGIQMNALRNEPFLQEIRERLPTEIANLKSIPGYAAVDIVDGGVHLTTEPIVLEHEGKRYPMGVFTVRLDPQTGKVDAWTDAPKHPEGHHHPHVERRALACYGNVTLAILKCMAGYRYKDAAETVIHWLRSYNAATTLQPIEQWPAEEEVAHAAE